MPCRPFPVVALRCLLEGSGSGAEDTHTTLHTRTLAHKTYSRTLIDRTLRAAHDAILCWSLQQSLNKALRALVVLRAGRASLAAEHGLQVLHALLPVGQRSRHLLDGITELIEIDA